MATLYSAGTIKNTLTLLSNFTNSMNLKTDIIKAKNRALNDLKLVCTMMHELAYTIDTNYIPLTKRELIAMEITVKDFMKNIEDTDDIRVIQRNLQGIIAIFEEDDILNRFDRYDITDAFIWVRYLDNNSYDSEREAISPTGARTIMNHININRPYNVFSPRCGNGQSLLLLGSFGESTTYGLEGRNSVHKEAREVLNRTIKGEISGSKISNDVFDIVHIAPEVSWKSEYGVTGNLLEKREKSTLRNCIKYLRKDGILIYTIPCTRLTKDMAFIFSKLLKDVQILKSNIAEGLPYIHVIGKKAITKEAKEDVYSYLRNIDIKNLPTELSDMKYNLASGGIKLPELFRGSILDEAELDNLIEHSGLLDSFWEQQELETNKKEINPLLPFTMGQIGLVLTSGCLDGVVEEYEGQYHAIKGMVTKIKNTSNSRENNNETSIETISNKVQINIMTPDGQFIELA